MRRGAIGAAGVVSLVTALAVIAPLQASRSCAPSNVLRDGGFELASGLPVDCPDWEEASIQFGSPLCTLALCITSNGAAPRTGEA